MLLIKSLHRFYYLFNSSYNRKVYKFESCTSIMARKPQNLDTLLLSVTNEETKELRAKIVLDILVSGNEVSEQYAKEAAGTYASKKEVGTAALIMEKAGYGPQ